MRFPQKLIIPMLLFALSSVINGHSAERDVGLKKVDPKLADEVWRKLIRSRLDINVATSAKLIMRVPAVQAVEGVTPLAASISSIIGYYNGRGKILGKLRDTSAAIRSVLLKNENYSSRKDLAQLVMSVWMKLLGKYNTDCANAHDKLSQIIIQR